MTAPFDIRGTITYDAGSAVMSVTQATKAVDAHAVALAKEGVEYARLRAAADVAIKSEQMFGSTVGATTAVTARATTGVGQFGSTVGLAGQAISRFNPAIGQTITVMGSALGSIQAMTTAGMGPLGIAVAAVSLAITAGTALIAAFGDEQRDAADAADELTAAMYRQVRANELAGEGRTAVLEADELRLQRTVDTLRASHGDAVLLYQQEQLLLAAQQQLARERQTDTTAPVSTPDGTVVQAGMERSSEEAKTEAQKRALLARRAAGAGGSEAREAAATAARVAEEQAAAAHNNALADQAQALEDRQLEILQKGLDERREAERLSRETATQNAIDDEEMRVTQVSRQIERETEAREKSAKVVSDIQAATMGAMNVVTAAVDAGLEGSRKSEKEKSKIKAQAALIQSIIGAALETAQAVAAYASFNIPQGIAHTAAAAMYVVAGVKAGAAAGGGGASASTPSTSGAGAGPMSTADGGGGKGGDVYNINWGNSALVYAADREQLGNALVDAIGSATSRRAA